MRDKFTGVQLSKPYDPTGSTSSLNLPYGESLGCSVHRRLAAPECESLLAWKNKRTSPNVGKHTLALTDGYDVQGFTIIAGAHDATAQHNMKYRSTLVYDNSKPL